VPITYADDIVPVTHTGCLHLHQHLAFTQRTRFRDLKRLHGATELPRLAFHVNCEMRRRANAFRSRRRHLDVGRVQIRKARPAQ
jgi:hypothetical protein